MRCSSDGVLYICWWCSSDGVYSTGCYIKTVDGGWLGVVRAGSRAWGWRLSSSVQATSQERNWIQYLRLLYLVFFADFPRDGRNWVLRFWFAGRGALTAALGGGGAARYSPLTLSRVSHNTTRPGDGLPLNRLLVRNLFMFITYYLLNYSCLQPHCLRSYALLAPHIERQTINLELFFAALFL